MVKKKIMVYTNGHNHVLTAVGDLGLKYRNGEN